MLGHIHSYLRGHADSKLDTLTLEVWKFQDLYTKKVIDPSFQVN